MSAIFFSIPTKKLFFVKNVILEIDKFRLIVSFIWVFPRHNLCTRTYRGLHIDGNRQSFKKNTNLV